VDLFFMSPPYADARAYSRIHPDRYVEWFLPFARAMYDATADTGSLVINIKNRVAQSGPLRGQRHPYVYQLVLALQHMGWRWLDQPTPEEINVIRLAWEDLAVKDSRSYGRLKLVCGFEPANDQTGRSPGIPSAGAAAVG
jgi:hypothetical protein